MVDTPNNNTDAFFTILDDIDTGAFELPPLQPTASTTPAPFLVPMWASSGSTISYKKPKPIKRIRHTYPHTGEPHVVELPKEPIEFRVGDVVSVMMNPYHDANVGAGSIRVGQIVDLNGQESIVFGDEDGFLKSDTTLEMFGVDFDKHMPDYGTHSLGGLLQNATGRYVCLEHMALGGTVFRVVNKYTDPDWI